MAYNKAKTHYNQRYVAFHPSRQGIERSLLTFSARCRTEQAEDWLRSPAGLFADRPPHAVVQVIMQAAQSTE